MNTIRATLIALLLGACAGPTLTPTDAMPAPTDSPLFATDATYAADGGDAWDGTATRADPGAAIRAEGFEPEELPAEWLNHVLGVHGDWIEHITNDTESEILTLAGFRGAPDVGADWFVDSNGWAQGAAGAKRYFAFDRIPDGSTITRVVATLGAHTGTATLRVYTFSDGGATLAETQAGTGGTLDTDTGGAMTPLAVDRSTLDYGCEVEVGGALSEIASVRVYYTRAVLP